MNRALKSTQCALYGVPLGFSRQFSSESADNKYAEVCRGLQARQGGPMPEIPEHWCVENGSKSVHTDLTRYTCEHTHCLALNLQPDRFCWFAQRSWNFAMKAMPLRIQQLLQWRQPAKYSHAYCKLLRNLPLHTPSPFASKANEKVCAWSKIRGSLRLQLRLHLRLRVREGLQKSSAKIWFRLQASGFRDRHFTYV
jgi:hypothetical protein